MNKFYIMFDSNRTKEDKDVIRINKTYSVKLVEGYTYRTPEFDKKSFCFNVWNHGGTWQAVSLNGLLICTAKSRKDVIAKVCEYRMLCAIWTATNNKYSDDKGEVFKWIIDNSKIEKVNAVA